jgi:hypothetical protein
VGRRTKENTKYGSKKSLAKREKKDEKFYKKQQKNT